jgi:hypothetical protein
VFREVPLLMKVGVIMMALALLIAAVVVSATVGNEPGQVVAAEVARRFPDEAPRTSSGEERSAPKKSSSETKSSYYRPRLGRAAHSRYSSII